MNLRTIKNRTFVLHVALIALYVLPAVAIAAVPSAADLLRYRSSEASKLRRVMVAFENSSLQLRELQIGAECFEFAPRGKGHRNVVFGAKVQVYSSMNSQLDGATVTTVSEHRTLREVVIHQRHRWAVAVS